MIPSITGVAADWKPNCQGSAASKQTKDEAVKKFVDKNKNMIKLFRMDFI